MAAEVYANGKPTIRRSLLLANLVEAECGRHHAIAPGYDRLLQRFVYPASGAAATGRPAPACTIRASRKESRRPCPILRASDRYRPDVRRRAATLVAAVLALLGSTISCASSETSESIVRAAASAQAASVASESSAASASSVDSRYSAAAASNSAATQSVAAASSASAAASSSAAARSAAAAASSSAAAAAAGTGDEAAFSPGNSDMG
jgi:hypothetical protein